MMANDRALKRGVVLAFLAALLQGLGARSRWSACAALIFNATAAEMNRAADWLALASYIGIIAIGAWLAWTKGRALVAALRARGSRAAPRSPAGRSTTARRGGRRRTSNGATAFRAHAPGEEAIDTRRLRPCARARRRRARRGLFLARRRRDGRRGGVAALFGRDSRARLRLRAGAVRRRRRRDLRDVAGHGADDRRARLGRRVRQGARHALGGGRRFARRAGGARRRIRSPRCWCSPSASRCSWARRARREGRAPCRAAPPPLQALRPFPAPPAHARCLRRPHRLSRLARHRLRRRSSIRRCTPSRSRRRCAATFPAGTSRTCSSRTRRAGCSCWCSARRRRST